MPTDPKENAPKKVYPNGKGPYTRRPYDALIHCGAKVDRNKEGLREKIEHARRFIAELEEIKKDRVLTMPEKLRYARRVKFLNWASARLKKIEDQGPDNRPCVKRKGQGTDHPDVGLCRFHCACKGRDGGHLSYYSRKSRDKRLEDIIEEMRQSGEDVLDLEPDVYMVRAKLKLFLEDKQDFEPETVKSLTLLAEQLRKTVDSIADKKFKSMITMDTFNLLMYRMAEVLMKHVSDPEVLERIQLDWAKISVETRAGGRKQLASAGNAE